MENSNTIKENQNCKPKTVWGSFRMKSNKSEEKSSFFKFFQRKTPKESKNNMVKNKNVTGTIQFDNCANSEVLNRIVTNSIIGTKLVDCCVICNKEEGTILVCNPSNYTPSIEQMGILINGFEDNEKISRSGFEIVTDVYEFEFSDENQIVGRLVGGVGGIALLKTTGNILVGKWSRRGEDPLNLLREIKDYLKNQGF